MSNSSGSGDHFEEIRAAIEHLEPELPQLVGSDYPAFASQLQTLLQARNATAILELFGRYPDALRQLRALRTDAHQRGEEPTRGFDLFPNTTLAGQEQTLPSAATYWCETGHHTVTQAKVKRHDISGHPLCPEHQTLLVDDHSTETE